MKRLLELFFKVILGVIVFTAAFFWFQDAPQYLASTATPVMVPDSSVIFYSDSTWVGERGERNTKQEIWDRIFSIIDNAHEFIILDFFLFNDFHGVQQDNVRALSKELTTHLVARKNATSSVSINFFTDPINEVYGGDISPQIVALSKAGIIVVETNLRPLRDSNMLWSAVWRSLIVWFGNSPQRGWLPHPFDANGRHVTLRSYFALLNFKANHRKLIIADEVAKEKNATTTRKITTLITSSNPHDGSSAHGNVALEVRDSLWRSAIESERASAHLNNITLPNYATENIRDDTGPIKVTLLRERQIQEKVLTILRGAKKGNVFDLAMFYLSDRAIIDELILASNRGAIIRVILDPNKDAFGHEKNGIPNRPVARELVAGSGGDIAIRWCDTHGEQCHAKLFMGTTGTSSSFMLLGSANFTRRNLKDYNLETSVIAESDKDFTARMAAQQYFDTLWENKGGIYTVEYSVYQDSTIWKPSIYRIMERTGVSSF